MANFKCSLWLPLKGSKDVTVIKSFQNFFYTGQSYDDGHFLLTSRELRRTWQLSSTLSSDASSSCIVLRMYPSESVESSGSRWDIMSGKW